MKGKAIILGAAGLLAAVFACRVPPSHAGSEYGQPGDEFIGIRYPLELNWMVESNPAFLPLVDRNTALGTFAPTFESSYLASGYFFMPMRTTLGFPDNRSGSGSVGLIVHNIGVSGIDGRGPNNEPLGSFSDSKSAISVLYGQKLSPYVSVGVAAKFINYGTSELSGTGLNNISKSAFGTDVGVCVEPAENLDLGLSISNAPVQPNVTLVNEEEKWPLTVHLDAGLDLLEGHVNLSAGVDYLQNSQRGGSGGIMRPEAGISYQVNDMLTVGAGYANEEPVGGVRIELPAISLQYSLENSDLGLLHYFSLGFGFGSTGQDRYAGLMGELPDALFAQALELYRKGRYFDAADKFACFHNLYPEHEKGPLSLDYLGRCFESVGARNCAALFYQRLVDEYRTSPLCPEAMGNVIRLRYELGDLSGVATDYRDLVERYPASEAAVTNRYYCGMVEYRNGRLDAAAELLSAVASTNENYLFAQYGLGLCYLNNPTMDTVTQINRAMEAFSSLLSPRGNLTPPEMRLRERATLVLGHLYRQKQQLSQAIERYASVTKGEYYREACLAEAYCYYDLGDCEHAIRLTEEILNSDSRDALYGEALFVRFLCVDGSGKNAEAESTSTELRRLSGNFALPAESERQKALSAYDDRIAACLDSTASVEQEYAGILERTRDGKPSPRELDLRALVESKHEDLENAMAGLNEYQDYIESGERFRALMELFIMQGSP